MVFNNCEGKTGVEYLRGIFHNLLIRLLFKFYFFTYPFHYLINCWHNNIIICIMYFLLHCITFIMSLMIEYIYIEHVTCFYMKKIHCNGCNFNAVCLMLADFPYRSIVSVGILVVDQLCCLWSVHIM